MNDYSELKKEAEARHKARWISMDGVSIKTILDLIADHDELVDLCARLAEPDALLREMRDLATAIPVLMLAIPDPHDRDGRDRHIDAVNALIEKCDVALSASAEPSAPVESADQVEIVAIVESALRRSFSLGQIYWQQADSDSTCQQNKSEQTMEVQDQHILNVVKSIKELI